MTPVQRSDLLTVAVLAAAVALSAAVVWLFVASGAGMPLSIALGLGAASVIAFGWWMHVYPRLP